MTPEELAQIENRLSKYRDAEHDCTRYEKLSRTLAAIKDSSDECEVTHIVIDVIKKEIRYITQDHGRMTIGLNICSIKRDEHEEIVDDFLAWAIAKIDSNLNDAQERIKMS